MYILFVIVEKYNNDLAEGLGPQVICYIYHFSVGRHGHVNANQGYGDVVYNTITALESEEQVEIVTDIHIHHKAIPHPGMVRGKAESVVSADVEDVNAE